jgi:hypothetical protein
MATLYIAEFETLGLEGQVAPLPSIVNQTRSLSGSSAQSSAFNAKTKYVRVQTDTACFVLVGANPTATTSHMPLAANVPEYFGVTGGDKIAAITA